MQEFILPTVYADEFFRYLSPIVDGCILQMSPQGWEVIALDPANVARIELHLPETSFIECKCGRETVQAGIDVSNIKRIVDEILDPLTRTEYGEDVLHFSLVHEGTKDQLRIKHGPFTEDVECLDVSSIRRPIPRSEIQIQIESVFDISTERFRRAIKIAASNQDCVQLSTRFTDCAGLLRIKADGNYPVKTDYEIPVQYRSVSNNTISLFSLDYLEEIVSAITAKSITLSLGTDCPLTIQFRIGNTGYGEYMQAPRVE